MVYIILGMTLARQEAWHQDVLPGSFCLEHTDVYPRFPFMEFKKTQLFILLTVAG